HLADLVGHRRQAVDVLLEAGPLAPAIALGELLGQFVESAIVAGPEFRGHLQGPSPPPGIVARASLSRVHRFPSGRIPPDGAALTLSNSFANAGISRTGSRSG